MQRGIENRLDRFTPGHQGRKSRYFDYGAATGKTVHVLQVQRSDGSYLALPYVYLSEIDYEPSLGIILKMGEYQITIRGRRLDYLFEQLCQYHVSQIRAAIHPMEDEVYNNENPPPTSGFQVEEIHGNKPGKRIDAQPLDYIERIDVVRTP